MVAEALANDEELSRVSQRTVPSVAALLEDIYSQSHHKIKHAVANLLQETFAATQAECETLFCSEICPHVRDVAARKVLRSWYQACWHSANNQDLLFDPSIYAVKEFGFPERTDAVRTVLETLSVLARDSDLNTTKAFAAPKIGGKTVTGRALGKHFEIWLLDTVLPSLGEKAVEQVNVALAATFFAHRSQFTVRLLTLPTSEPSDREAYDTKLEFAVTDSRAVTRTFGAVVNVKYESDASTSAGNSGGTRMLAHAMLPDKVAGWTEVDLVKAINSSLRVGAGESYSVPDGDYWFWVFKNSQDEAPIADSHVTSLLTVAPEAKVAHANTAESKDTDPVRVNMAQSFPGLQLQYEAASRRSTTPSTALEARDRLWNWYLPIYVGRHQMLAANALEGN